MHFQELIVDTAVLITLFSGNHGEDVKECYYYLDSTPTHSYMKALYKYPQNEYPYSWLVNENRNRSRQQPEFELTDTGKEKISIYYLAIHAAVA